MHHKGTERDRPLLPYGSPRISSLLHHRRYKEEAEEAAALNGFHCPFSFFLQWANTEGGVQREEWPQPRLVSLFNNEHVYTDRALPAPPIPNHEIDMDSSSGSTAVASAPPSTAIGTPPASTTSTSSANANGDQQQQQAPSGLDFGSLHLFGDDGTTVHLNITPNKLMGLALSSYDDDLLPHHHHSHRTLGQLSSRSASASADAFLARSNSSDSLDRSLLAIQLTSPSISTTTTMAQSPFSAAASSAVSSVASTPLISASLHQSPHHQSMRHAPTSSPSLSSPTASPVSNQRRHHHHHHHHSHPHGQQQQQPQQQPQQHHHPHQLSQQQLDQATNTNAFLSFGNSSNSGGGQPMMGTPQHHGEEGDSFASPSIKVESMPMASSSSSAAATTTSPAAAAAANSRVPSVKMDGFMDESLSHHRTMTHHHSAEFGKSDGRPNQKRNSLPNLSIPTSIFSASGSHSDNEQAFVCSFYYYY